MDVTPLVYIKQGLQFETFGKKSMKQYEQKVLDLLELSINDLFALKFIIKKKRKTKPPTLKMKKKPKTKQSNKSNPHCCKSV